FFGLAIIALFMMLIMGWVWGGAKIIDAANEAGDFKLPSWYKWVVKVVSPVGIIVALVFVFMQGFYMPGAIALDPGTAPGLFLIPFIWFAVVVVVAILLWRMKGVE
ncbi:MAG: hypothetical protein ACXADS_15860, partial [Candidatus Thorarchaeota archaeon]